MFIAHAYLKLAVFTVPGFEGFLGQVGLPTLLAWPTILAELVGGLAILAGFYGRLVSVALLAALVGACPCMPERLGVQRPEWRLGISAPSLNSDDAGIRHRRRPERRPCRLRILPRGAGLARLRPSREPSGNPRGGTLKHLAWDDFRLVKAVAEARGMPGAATKLGINHSTVFRRLSQIEQALGTKLFERHRTGYALTPAGEEMVSLAQRLDSDITAFTRKLPAKWSHPRASSVSPRVTRSHPPAHAHVRALSRPVPRRAARRGARQ